MRGTTKPEEMKDKIVEILKQNLFINTEYKDGEIAEQTIEGMIFAATAIAQLYSAGEEVKESVRDWNEWEEEAKEWFELFSLEAGSIATMEDSYISGYKMGCSNQFTRILKRTTVSEEEIEKQWDDFTEQRIKDVKRDMPNHH